MPTPASRIDPRLLAAAGAACISGSAILMKLSGTSAGTGAFFRCLLALAVLIPLAVAERRRIGTRPMRARLLDVLGGAFLGVDLVAWGASIGDLGAGIATVLVNVQVIVVPMLAWLVFRERPPRRFLAIAPMLLIAVALASGAVGGAAPGSHPMRGALLGTGAGVAYGGYLLLLRRAGSTGHRFQPVCWATVGAAISATALGSSWHGIDLTPGWSAFGWLVALALSGQVCGWLLVGAALPQLRSAVGATLLLLQPVLSVLFGMALLGERPLAGQLLGSAAVLAAVWFASTGTAGHSTARRPAVTPSAETRQLAGMSVGSATRSDLGRRFPATGTGSRRSPACSAAGRSSLVSPSTTRHPSTRRSR